VIDRIIFLFSSFEGFDDRLLVQMS
jgi:hypothetical protein